MLRFSNPKVHAHDPLFSATQQYRFHLFAGNSHTTSKTNARVINQNVLFWDEDIGLRLGDDNIYQFSITTDNPQQSRDPIIKQQIKISKHVRSETEETWRILSSDNIQIGRLSCRISTRIRSITNTLMKSQKHQTIDTDIPNRNIKRVIRILSLIAKCNSQGADVRASGLSNSGDAVGQSFIKKGYFSIHIDQDVIKTPSIISRAGELIFAEPRQIEVGSIGTIQFKVWDGFGKISLFGEASMELNEWKPNKKLALVKDTFEVGELYIESRLVSKDQIITTNHTENPFKSLSPKPIPELQHSSQPKLKHLFYTPGIQPSTRSAYRSMDISELIQAPSRLSPRASSRLQSSMVSSSSARKKNSVINDNGSIFFSKEKRFNLYQDRQNQKISYLEGGERSFFFKESGIGGRYRGATFGYGNKADFVSGRNLPGVGDYKLPSIWDKY